MKRVGTKTLRKEASLLRCLVYGPPGSGKTWFGASAALSPLTSPVMYLDYRGQITSLLQSQVYLDAVEDGRLVILRIDKYEDLNQVYAWLKRGGGKEPGLDKAFPTFPKTMVLDSLTELQRDEVLRRGGNEPDRFSRDIQGLEIRDWGIMLNQFALLGRLWYELPMHVVFTALERVTFDDKDKLSSVSVAMQGQAADQFPGYAHLVIRLEAAPPNAKQFNVALLRAAKSLAKNQTAAKLPTRILGPTLPMIVRALGGEEVTGATDPEEVQPQEEEATDE